MEKLSQEYILMMVFTNSLNREKLLVSKYRAYEGALKNKELKEMVKEFYGTAQEHLKLMKDKMIKLDIK